MAKKVFDSQVDKSVVGLSSEEKEALRKRFAESQKQMEPQQKTTARGSQAQASKPKPVSVFKILWNFVLSMILNIPFRRNADISVTRVRQIKKHLNNLGVIFFDFKSNSVTSEFALFVLDIYRGARAVYDVFLNPKEDRDKEQFVRVFFESVLSEKTLQIQNIFTRESLEEVFYDESITGKRDYLKKQQKEYMHSFKTHDYKSVQNILLPLDQLINVYHYFDFQSFFSLFGAFKNSQLSVDHQKVEPEEVLPFLTQLGAVCKVITETGLTDKCQGALEKGNQAMKDAGSKTKGKFLAPESVNKGLMLIRKLVKFNIIDSMIQYITMDETQASGYVKPQKFIINRYMNQIANETIRLFNQIEDEKTKEFLMKNILTFFDVHSEKDLKYPGFYTPDNKSYFEKMDIKGFTQVKPLGILLTFLDKHYEGYLREVINTIVVKGNFIKKAESESFSTLYYNLDDVIDKLHTFVRTELAPPEEGKNLIVELLHVSKELTPVEKKTVRQKINTYDTFLESLIEQIVEIYFNIFVFLTKISKDYKKRHPEIVGNIRNLPPVKNHSFQTGLEHGMDIMDRFFQIMRNYVVIKAEINEVFQKLDALGK